MSKRYCLRCDAWFEPCHNDYGMHPEYQNICGPLFDTKLDALEYDLHDADQWLDWAYEHGDGEQDILEYLLDKSCAQGKIIAHMKELLHEKQRK